MFARVIVALTVLTAALTALVTGCGSPHQATEQNTVAPAQSPSPAGHKVGDTVTVSHGDKKYDVTLVSVAEPARAASEYLAPTAGHHFAAAEFRVTAVTEVDENSNTNATVIGSNDQQYTSSVMEVAEGTNFASGSIRLQPGGSLVGWVPFEIPDGVRVAKVRWSPGAGFGGRGAEWTVNTTTSPSPAASPTAQSPSPGAASPPAATAGGGPRDTVIAYFDAINSGDYRTAWDLGGKNSTSSYSSFVDGFKTTSAVSAEILGVSGDVVTVRLTTLETDGTSKVFKGDYTVQDGVITGFKVNQVS